MRSHDRGCGGIVLAGRLPGKPDSCRLADIGPEPSCLAFLRIPFQRRTPLHLSLNKAYRRIDALCDRPQVRHVNRLVHLPPGCAIRCRPRGV
jgi:hypothetical protein